MSFAMISQKCASSVSIPPTSSALRSCWRIESASATHGADLTLDRAPNALRGGRPGNIGDPERRQRVEKRIGDGGEGADRTGLAAAFDAERVGRAARAVKAEVV